MAATQYISKWQGIDIDAAVSYYKSVTAATKPCQAINIAQTATTGVQAWANSSDANGKYKCEITLTGIDTAGTYPPTVYLIQTAVYGTSPNTIGVVGQQWNLDYIYTYADNKINKVTVYSNIPLTGTIVIAATAIPTP